MKVESAPLLGLIAGLALMTGAFAPRPAALIWNRTASVPTGLYFVSDHAAPERGELVAYRPSPDEAVWIAARGYTGRDWPLIKRIAAISGDEVCRFRETVFINGAFAARAMTRDGDTAKLPVWQGCRHLAPWEVFLLGDHPRSIDGRYLGPQASRRILGKVTRIWPGFAGAGSVEARDRPSTGDFASQPFGADFSPRQDHGRAGTRRD